MDLVTSRDGTPIGVWRSGSGPPLLLVHGATADHSTTWRLVAPLFEDQFTVLTMDRRGRGASGDAPTYELAREAEDIAAVVESIGRAVCVVGHSYGALCALEAALLTTRISRLVLYEGVPLDGTNSYPPGIIDRMEALLAAGDAEGALVAMYRDIVEMPDSEIELLRSNAEAWAVRLVNVRRMPREAATERRYRFEAARFRGLRAPTLLLVGGDSPRREHDNARGVAEALYDARVVVMPGQQHAATYTAPELFVREVEQFAAP